MPTPDPTFTDHIDDLYLKRRYDEIAASAPPAPVPPVPEPATIPPGAAPGAPTSAPVMAPASPLGREPEVAQTPVPGTVQASSETPGTVPEAFLGVTKTGPAAPKPTPEPGSVQADLVRVPGAETLGLTREGMSALARDYVPEGPAKSLIVKAAHGLDLLANLIGIPARVLGQAASSDALLAEFHRVGIDVQDPEKLADMVEFIGMLVAPAEMLGAGNVVARVGAAPIETVTELAAKAKTILPTLDRWAAQVAQSNRRLGQLGGVPGKGETGPFAEQLAALRSRAAETEKQVTAAEQASRDVLAQSERLLRPPTEDVAQGPEAARVVEALGPDVMLVGDKAVRLDFAALTNRENVLRAVDEIANAAEEQVGTVNIGKLTRNRLAKLETLLGAPPGGLSPEIGKALSPQQLYGAARLVEGTMAKLTEANARYEDALALGLPTIEALRADRDTALAAAGTVVSQFFEAGGEAGSALQAFGQAASTLSPAARQISDILNLARMGGSDARITGLVSALKTTPQKSGFLHSLSTLGKAVPDVLIEAWINGLLTTFSGNTANFVSNMMMTASRLAETTLAAGYSAVRGAAPGDRVYFSELPVMLHGAVVGFQEGLAAAGKMLEEANPVGAVVDTLRGQGTLAENLARTPTSAFRSGKLVPTPGGKYVRALSSENLRLTGIPGMAVDALGQVVNTPVTLMASADELSKWTNYRMVLWGLAEREARASGLTGAERTAFVQKFIAEDTKAIQIARDEANYLTFNQPFEYGSMGAGMQQALKNPLARLIVPFFRTPARIALTNLERVPGVGSVLNSGMAAARDEIAGGGAAADLRLAKMSLGAMVISGAIYLAANGRLGGDVRINGSGPINPALRKLWRDEQGNVPYSIQVRDSKGAWTTYEYNRFDAYGMLFGTVADYVDIQGQLRDNDADAAATAILLAVSNNVLSKTYLKGLSDFLETVMAKDPRALEKHTWVKSMAGSVVPTGAGQIERYVDPTVRATYGLLDMLKSRIPGYSATLFPEVAISGRPVLSPPGYLPEWVPEWFDGLRVAAPMRSQTLSDDPVVKELLDNQIAISRVPPFIFGRNPNTLQDVSSKDGLPLTDEQHYDYARYAGNDLKVPANAIADTLGVPREALDDKKKLGMWDTLGVLVQSPLYKNYLSPGPDGSRAATIRKIVSGYREWAKWQLLEDYPDLKHAYEVQVGVRAKALIGPLPPPGMTSKDVNKLLEGFGQ